MFTLLKDIEELRKVKFGWVWENLTLLDTYVSSMIREGLYPSQVRLNYKIKLNRTKSGATYMAQTLKGVKVTSSPTPEGYVTVT